MLAGLLVLFELLSVAAARPRRTIALCGGSSKRRASRRGGRATRKALPGCVHSKRGAVQSAREAGHLPAGDERHRSCTVEFWPGLSLAGTKDRRQVCG
jgi:hypothetical protein